MSITMRAKMQVHRVERFQGGDKVKMAAVAGNGSYPEDGSDEDNTYAKFSPSGELELTIANPALLGKIEPGQKFYLDFTPA
jgi:hypothetical protein